ncbi:MAG: MBOAT family protein [Saprospiraceae bacterium]|nr:MBOAT family protein [Saprospiraceae bacterium]
MLFNSVDFAIFLPLVLLLYWSGLLRNVRDRNGFLVVVSYLFYGWWDWRFLLLIVFSSALDFSVGKQIAKAEDQWARKRWLWLSISTNVGLLGFFKYYNFFIDSFLDAFQLLGLTFSPHSLQLILPVGISFYTFQTMSYTIDVYRRKTEATDDALAFFAYVSFFPQLVAGPIERATSFLPQFYQLHTFRDDRFRVGLQLILWGLFKKMVIADNCAYWVDQIFADPGEHSSLLLVLGILLFAFQIYGDFSGYSDIAIGTGRLLGFELRKNFAYPYFSRDVAEFWRRWHISLSTWFRDYVYIPLGGSRVSQGKQIRNVFMIFLLSGFWHGANWTFLAWGFLHALFFLPLILLGRNRKYLEVAGKDRWLPTLGEGLRMLLTFGLVGLAWVLFRAESVGEAMEFYQGLLAFSMDGWKVQHTFPLLGVSCLLVIEWFSRNTEIPFLFRHKMVAVRWSSYWGMALAILLFSPAEPSVFIYFQF